MGYLLAKADERNTQFLATCCTVAQGQIISFLKLLLSFCKDNRMNTELVMTYDTILEKKTIIFLIKPVFCEHANKKEKNITAMYCKPIAKRDLISF